MRRGHAIFVREVGVANSPGEDRRYFLAGKHRPHTKAKISWSVRSQSACAERPLLSDFTSSADRDITNTRLTIHSGDEIISQSAFIATTVPRRSALNTSWPRLGDEERNLGPG